MNDINALLEQLQNGPPLAKRTAALRLGAMRNPVLVPDLIRAADTPDASLRSLLASALAASAAPDTLRPALTHPSTYVRQTGVAALRHMPAAAVPLLIERLADDDPDVQQAAAAALQHHDTAAARRALQSWQDD